MKSILSAFIKQPLVHFFIAAVAIFIAYDFLAEAPAESMQQSTDIHQIIVGEAELLEFMQYRAKAFEPELFKARLAALSEQEKQALVTDYVREETLYREALKMGLENGDYIIRQRLIQKVEFLLDSLLAEELEPDDKEIEDFYQSHIEDYRVDQVYTFTHIFFDAKAGGMELAERRARQLLNDHPEIAFNDASQYGDRYAFLQNYVERTRDFVINNFNQDFVDELDKLEISPAAWAGPFESRYGQHLVLLRARTPSRLPDLEEIKERVASDYRYETRIHLREQAEARVIADYELILAL